ncbi:unnamed protein product [Pieris macdunnoughi]|uniref:Uncharacterized protein n=1 Tax=Pieris macdunnoughi TaxID=345717 RepID=A0A821P0K4_9NEOP|nr:unnamed protein product [Pieris macdunnoughi]
MLCSGIGNLTLAPIIGAIRDNTNNYQLALNMITAIFGVIGITYMCKLLYKNNCSQGHQQKSPVLNKNLNVA